MLLNIAVVQPIRKKTGLDPNELGNFLPISKLPFLSKALEKVIFDLIPSYLVDFCDVDPFQFGLHPFHSTKSAHLWVFNDILLATDSGLGILLVILDLLSAFDTVYHSILLSRLNQEIGVQGLALELFRFLPFCMGFHWALSLAHCSFHYTFLLLVPFLEDT